MLREPWRKSCGSLRYLQQADPAKIGKETTNLQSLTKKVVHVCAHSGKAVNKFLRYIGRSCTKLPKIKCPMNLILSNVKKKLFMNNLFGKKSQT
jgi:hypothetical protein